MGQSSKHPIGDTTIATLIRDNRGAQGAVEDKPIENISKAPYSSGRGIGSKIPD